MVPVLTGRPDGPETSQVQDNRPKWWENAQDGSRFRRVF
jgi:hypothetical protein